VSARYEAGKANFAQLTSITIEQERARESVRTIKEERKNSETAIRAALLLPESISIGTPVLPKLRMREAKADDLYPLALERRQELKAKRAMIGRMERMLEMAETMIYPGFSQELSLFAADAISQVSGNGIRSTANKQGNMAGGAGSFPGTSTGSSGSGIVKMPWFGTEDAYLRQTRQRIDSLKKELEASSAATVLGVRRAWFRVDKAKRELALYQERVVPLSKANLDAATQNYSTGQVDFSELIKATNSWLDANLSLARTQADLAIALAELDAAVGVDQVGGKRPVSSGTQSRPSQGRKSHE
ncbi:MAG: TolC family protein, partial [Desulfobulbaceae bacterium]|nr:TolC family protein [Desulfobulbaceae bacterium]